MINAREQIKTMLESITLPVPFEVKMQFPQSITDGVQVTYFELTNENTVIPVVDKIAFQIDCWAYDMETLTEMYMKIDELMRGTGFLRQYSSPDILPSEIRGYYRKTLRYGRRVDTRTNRLID